MGTKSPIHISCANLQNCPVSDICGTKMGYTEVNARVVAHENSIVQEGGHAADGNSHVLALPIACCPQRPLEILVRHREAGPALQRGAVLHDGLG